VATELSYRPVQCWVAENEPLTTEPVSTVGASIAPGLLGFRLHSEYSGAEGADRGLL